MLMLVAIELILGRDLLLEHRLLARIYGHGDHIEHHVNNVAYGGDHAERVRVGLRERHAQASENGQAKVEEHDPGEDLGLVGRPREAVRALERRHVACLVPPEAIPKLLEQLHFSLLTRWVCVFPSLSSTHNYRLIFNYYLR